MRDIFWVSTFEYIAVYEIQAEMRVVYIQNVRNLLANSFQKIVRRYSNFSELKISFCYKFYKGH